MGGYSFADRISKDEPAIYIGVIYGMWGHLLTDALKKLWFLNSPEGIRLLEQGWRVVYITKNNKPLPAYCNQLISLAGFDMTKWERVSEVTGCERIIVPDSSIVLRGKERYYSEAYVKIIQKIKESVQAQSRDLISAERVYFTRSQLKGHRDVGEKRIERAFYKSGYTIVAPERCSIEQQVYYMMTCKYFATTEGSCAHNSLFCPDSTEVVILRKSDYVNSYQIMINEMANLNVTYIDANRTINAYPQSKWDGPFYLDVTDGLKQYLKQDVVCFPYFLRCDYIVYVISVLLRKVKRILMAIIRDRN